MNEPFLTIKEFAKRRIIPIGKTKLYELVQLGFIRSYRVGGKVLVLESEVWQDIKTRFHLRGRANGKNRVRQEKEALAGQL